MCRRICDSVFSKIDFRGVPLDIFFQLIVQFPRKSSYINIISYLLARGWRCRKNPSGKNESLHFKLRHFLLFKLNQKLSSCNIVKRIVHRYGQYTKKG